MLSVSFGQRAVARERAGAIPGIVAMLSNARAFAVRSAIPQHHRVAARPRLLFLAQALPYPPDAGVKIRTYHTLRLLSQAFDVTALCFYRVDHHEGPGRNVATALQALSSFARVEAFPIPQEHNRARLIWDHARSLATGRVYTVPAYDSAAFRERVRAWLRAVPFDVVHLDSLDLSGYLPLLRGRRVVCTHHDLQSSLLRRRVESEPRWWRRAYMAHQARLMAREEARACIQVSLNVTVSPVDARRLLELVPDAQVTVVPNGVDVDFYRPAPGPGHGVVSVGGTNWAPNRDGLVHLCEDILPSLRRLGVTAPVTWLGRADNRDRYEFLRRYGVTLTGYVDDIRPYLREAACYVVPIRVGGGTRVKILDAWAMGKAVVSTRIGCEGLHAIDGYNILIRDDPRAFAEAVRDVLEDEELRLRLGRAARETAESHYGWDVIGERMIADYLAVCARR